MTPSVLVTERSAWAITVVITAGLVLSASAGSTSLPRTVATLASAAVCPGSTATTKLDICPAPGASAATGQVTVPPVSVQPSPDETKLVPAGRTSLAVPPVDGDGPALTTVKV